MTEPFLTARQVADMLGFSADTIVDWAEAGKLPAFKLGGRLRFQASELEEHLQDCRLKVTEKLR